MLPAPTHLFALLVAAIATVALVRAAYRWQPMAPPPAGHVARPRTLATIAAVALISAIALDHSAPPAVSAAPARDAALLLAAILAVLAASRWAEGTPDLMGLRGRLLNRDLPTLAALCALIGAGALAVLHGRSPVATAIVGASAAVLAGALPALHAAARLRAGRDGGRATTTVGFALLLALALCGVLRHVG